jgi:hypothetical protein
MKPLALLNKVMSLANFDRFPTAWNGKQASVPDLSQASMIAQLTRNERHSAILMSLAVAICGFLLGLAGRDDPR